MSALPPRTILPRSQFPGVWIKRVPAKGRVYWYWHVATPRPQRRSRYFPYTLEGLLAARDCADGMVFRHAV